MVIHMQLVNAILRTLYSIYIQKSTQENVKYKTKIEIETEINKERGREESLFEKEKFKSHSIFIWEKKRNK